MVPGGAANIRHVHSVVLGIGIAVLLPTTDAGSTTPEPALNHRLPAVLRAVAKLNAANALLAHIERPRGDALTDAVALAKAGATAQAGIRGLGMPRLAEPEAHGSPADAAAALAAAADVVLDADALSQLARIGGVSGAALAKLIDAFASFAAQSRTGDAAGLVEARNEVLDATVALRDALTGAEGCAPVHLPPLLSVDLGACDSTYTDDVMLLVDAGGNDSYLNNAGGNVIVDTCYLPEVEGDAAALLDLAGDDSYGDPARPYRCGTNGGGYFGSGLLVDGGGNDVYRGGGAGVNGGGVGTGASGFLVDAGGADAYATTGGLGANGGGAGGAGFLLDRMGDDVYAGGGRGVNGGGYLGAGFLVDGGGADVYTAEGAGTNGGGSLTVQGSGFLLDASGDDTYSAAGDATNGGASFAGAGFLLDAAGSDDYDAADQGTNGGGFVDASGFLADLGGDDSYAAGALAANGGAIDGATGVLFDGGGGDLYRQGGRADADCTRIPKGTGAQVDVPNHGC
jgi:hypothetical protein